MDLIKSKINGEIYSVFALHFGPPFKMFIAQTQVVLWKYTVTIPLSFGHSNIYQGGAPVLACSLTCTQHTYGDLATRRTVVPHPHGTSFRPYKLGDNIHFFFVHISFPVRTPNPAPTPIPKTISLVSLSFHKTQEKCLSTNNCFRSFK